MPGGDGTGPRGEGPMTGRRAGYCVGYSAPGYANQGPRLGLGRGLGRGRGFRRFPGYGRGLYGPAAPVYGTGVAPVYQEPSVEEERTYLKNVMDGLEEELKEVKKRLQELEKEK